MGGEGCVVVEPRAVHDGSQPLGSHHPDPPPPPPPPSSSDPVAVRISQSSPARPLVVTVIGPISLSSHHQQALLEQVRRMLRISDQMDRTIQDFHKLHPESKKKGFGRIFRSPTLFEDMVKCMLLCNCQIEYVDAISGHAQFHARERCTIRSMQNDVEFIYEKYAPFQFLVYWSELWDYYEQRFGKSSEMLPSDYRVITSSKMKPKISRKR